MLLKLGLFDLFSFMTMVFAIIEEATSQADSWEIESNKAQIQMPNYKLANY